MTDTAEITLTGTLDGKAVRVRLQLDADGTISESQQIGTRKNGRSQVHAASSYAPTPPLDRLDQLVDDWTSKGFLVSGDTRTIQGAMFTAKVTVESTDQLRAALEKLQFVSNLADGPIHHFWRIRSKNNTAVLTWRYTTSTTNVDWRIVDQGTVLLMQLAALIGQPSWFQLIVPAGEPLTVPGHGEVGSSGSGDQISPKEYLSARRKAALLSDLHLEAVASDSWWKFS
jgi:hypothetical protein